MVLSVDDGFMIDNRPHDAFFWGFMTLELMAVVQGLPCPTKASTVAGSFQFLVDQHALSHDSATAVET